ncbi:MAG: hypothetical protein ACFCUU_02935 [Cyclobacteriaceae bacterium]
MVAQIHKSILPYFTRIFLIFLITGTGYNPMLAQSKRILMLEKSGTHKSTWFEVNNDIRFKLVGDDHFRTDKIRGFGDDHLEFKYYNIELEEIASIDIRKKTFANFNFRNASAKLIFVGFGLLAIDAFNQRAIAGNEYQISTGIIVTAISFEAAGLTLGLFRPRYFKPNYRYKLRITEIRA